MRWENTVTIEAPAEVVWRLTVDVTNLPAITPTMTRVIRLDDGPMRVGSRARIKQPGQPEAVWTVTRIDEGREFGDGSDPNVRQFTWETKRMGLAMTGSHLIRQVGDQCQNTLVLDVQGRGAGLFGRIFGRALRSAIETENAGFRTAAQQAA
jgi:carbon monoxide dehydrogenase subunit G